MCRRLHGVTTAGHRHGRARLGLLTQFTRHLFHIATDKLALAVQEAGKQQAVAVGIDPPRNATAGFEDGFKGAGIEAWRPLRAGTLQTMFDVGLRLVLIHRADMAGGDHALPQLLHLRTLHDLAKLRLANQEALQQGLGPKLEIGQHAQFLDRARRQVLCLIDDQQAAFALASDIDQKRLEGEQSLRLSQVPATDTKCSRHHAQRVLGVKLCAHQLCGDHLL
ncbi:MAG: hypothetical protein AW08_01419 [Candidatus Accumulibacter adjunctus]|uniref:Uncharacterized protein n=1 Tax=Candidatus Accumulibacter adjunctus TaxID=1454001 RepID=A0A011N031_9PROT|nr:MAG: hypothetical protein AW08_01419 [Candidatus Accumulibacter adjunctus]